MNIPSINRFLSDDSPEALRSEFAIDLRFGQVGMVQVRVRTTDVGVIVDELTGRVASAPQLLERAAACVDLTALKGEPQAEEILAVIGAVRRVGFLVAGISHESANIDALARAVDTAVITQFRPQRKAATAKAAAAVEVTTSPPVVTPAPVTAPAPAAETSVPALIHHQTVRSGQRVYARHRDLVAMNVVGAGAEVMADGCVHIYSALRGRAMAGVRGDTNARVFCQEFNAELVSIAGVFRVFETIPPELAGKPVQAWLAGEYLHFAPIGN